jgi:prepilin-type N-terminal cleavage/methylation domain-containing protein
VSRARRENGVTLIEIIVVLLVIALVTAALTVGYGRLPATVLKHEAVHIAAVVRSAYDRATTSGALHRVVLDLDEGSYHVERCEGKIELRRSRDVKEEAERQRDEAERAELAAQLQTPDSVLKGMLKDAGQTVGGSAGTAAAKCTPVSGDMGKPTKLGGHPKVSFGKVYVGHLEEPAQKGKVTINFFPLGTAEKAIIQLAVDEENVFSIAIHPLSGKIDMAQGAMSRPDDFMANDATGNRT